MLRIVQLTDCHLFADPATSLRGIVTWPRFVAVLQSLRQQLERIEVTCTVPRTQIQTREPSRHRDTSVRHALDAIDLLVITGDIAHDEIPLTYDAVIHELGDWISKVRVVPGNHDHRRAIQDRFPGSRSPCTGRATFDEQFDHWQVIGLDSQRPGEVAGSLGDVQLSWLRQRLETTRNFDTLLFLHHPPIAVQAPWLDKIGLQDAEDLNRLLSDFPRVKLIGCGHVHHEVVATFGPATVFTTPAVGPKFRPRTEALVIEEGPPEFRLWELFPSGQWSTQRLC